MTSQFKRFEVRANKPQFHKGDIITINEHQYKYIISTNQEKAHFWGVFNLAWPQVQHRTEIFRLDTFDITNLLNCEVIGFI